VERKRVDKDNHALAGRPLNCNQLAGNAPKNAEKRPKAIDKQTPLLI
jgi:hypothetical protein